MREVKLHRVLFYSNTPRAFQTTLIGVLYEISQEFSVTLLSEEMDNETSIILRDKDLFPNLDRIIPVYQHTGPKMSLVSKHRYLSSLARKVISECPDIVVASSDWHSAFEMYLMRFAKELGLLRVTVQDTFVAEMKEASKWVDMINLYEITSSWIPLCFRQLIIKLRKYAGYCVYHFLLPLAAGQGPFFMRYSFVLLRGSSGCGDSQYQVVLSQRDYEIYKINGVSASKLIIMAHPITRNAKMIFDRLVKPTSFNSYNRSKMLLVLLPAEEIGIRRGSYDLIPSNERLQMHVRILQIIENVLPDYLVIVKPHPLTKNLEKRRTAFSQISKNIHFCDPSEPVEKWIEAAEIILELPLAGSTALFRAILQCPEKAIMAIDFQNDFRGDVYRDFAGIEYLDSAQSLVRVLEEIRDGVYKKNISTTSDNRSSTYQTFAVLLKELYRKRPATK